MPEHPLTTLAHVLARAKAVLEEDERRRRLPRPRGRRLSSLVRRRPRAAQAATRPARRGP